MTTPTIFVAFDKHNNKPLYAVLKAHTLIKFLPLFLKGLGTKLITVYDNLQLIEDVIKCSNVMVNDACSLLPWINIHPSHRYKLYDARVYISTDNLPESEIKKLLCRYMLDNTAASPWMEIKGRAAIVYNALSKRGVLYGKKLVHPIYDTKTISGRSRTTQFNIQGLSPGTPIFHPNRKYEYLICFDWVAADLRMAGLISGDEFINVSFKKYDPYTVMAVMLSTKGQQISREECKLEFLRSLYAMDGNGMFMTITSGLKKWMEKYLNAESNMFSTLMEMPIISDKLRTKFNAIIQGSVAEAIQNVLGTISRYKFDNVLTETHDSLVIACDKGSIEKWVEIGSKLMLTPFVAYNKPHIRMPVKVKIGKIWGKWAECATFH